TVPLPARPFKVVCLHTLVSGCSISKFSCTRLARSSAKPTRQALQGASTPRSTRAAACHGRSQTCVLLLHPAPLSKGIPQLRIRVSTDNKRFAQETSYTEDFGLGLRTKAAA